MRLDGLLALIEQSPAFSQLVAELQGTGRPVEGGPSGRPIYLGLLRAAMPAVLAALHRTVARPIMVVMTRSADAVALAEQLRLWLPDTGNIYRYPEPDILPYERMPWATETRQQRLAALSALRIGEGGGPPGQRADVNGPPLVVTSIRALLRKTLPPREFLLGARVLKAGQTASLSKLLAHWYAYGYEPVQVVEEPGQFSHRGGIVDVFSPQCELPVRLDFFGDVIDSIRTFDPTSQRSRDRLDAIQLIPAREALPKFGPAAAERFEQLDRSACHSAARNEYERDLDLLRQSAVFHHLEFYIPYLYAQPASLLDYLPDDGLLIIDDWAQLTAKALELDAQALDLRRDMTDAGELPPGAVSSHFSWEAETNGMAAILERAVALVLGDAPPFAPQADRFREIFGAAPRYGGQLKRILAEWRTRSNPEQRQVVISRQAQRLADLLAADGFPTALTENVEAPLAPGSLTLVHGALAEGWTFRANIASPDARPDNGSIGPDVVLLTDAEVFGIGRPEPRRPKPRKAIAPEAFFADLSPGDYVVHIEHGIGVFRGLVRMSSEAGGPEQEYVRVDYAEGDQLYVPIHQVDRLSRYVGGGVEPTIYRLGSAEWPRVKARAQRAVEEIADELLELYAARHVIPGHAFSPDDQWQRELEASFPYVETQDQLDAIQSVKRDMETPRPMDRLVTGDVGYGKTEVALRAAFKAVTDGYQVAVLVPTTVLAQQHYQTFTERLAPFPVEVEMLSRFRSRKMQEQIVRRLAEGRIDIVIGTHRLIQRDVRFKNLGLLIIDEEQRFGVVHKERLKQMRKEVDVLTLTATPIPRTLYMALTGARDMSAIDTPPDQRLPIKTHIAEYDDNLVRQAIVRELNRGGQVYFVHNRVQGIRQIAQRVQRLVPEAVVAIGHGQMPEAELEKVMLDFAAGHIDVLVCTSIIESGLDIPNANTIIINRADRFGLAQLYQLRGRVGRSTVRAYAYLLYAPHQPLSEVATQRLEAIARASELGAGFQVAMYDLEIRGAGEILGSRQHGHIAAIGFDLYMRLLAQAIDRLKGQKWPLPAEQARRREPDVVATLLEPLDWTVQIALPMPAYLPEKYVFGSELRLKLYQRMARLRSEEEIEAMKQELLDRFGPLPPEAQNLLSQLQFKVWALRGGVESIAVESGQIVVRFGSLSQGDRQYVASRLSGQARFGKHQIWLPFEGYQDWPTLLMDTLKVLAGVAARNKTAQTQAST